MYPDPAMQPMLGSSHYPPSFSYAQSTPHAQHRGGAHMGNVLVSGGVGAASGIIDAAQMGVMGAGFVHAGSAGLKALGLMRAPVLASGLIGTGATSSLAMGMVGGPVGLGLMAAGAGMGVAMHGVQTANQVGSMFGNMQFANAGGDPRTGRGFSQRDLMTLQRGIHNIEANNPFVSMSDAMRAADRFTEMGMHQGLQDAEKLAKKVTQLGKTMHAMARQLGTSMEEAGAIFKDMKGSGFYSAQDVMGNTANMTLMRGFGMTSDQFAGMQRAGAGMTRSAMMSGKSGAGVVTAKTAEFMSAIRSGAMDANQMMDITGASTPLEAAQMLAQQTLSGTMQGLSGGLGTAMMLAAGQTDKSGRFTGEIDAGVLQKMASGTMTRDEMNRLGGKKRDSREGQASFVARKQDITESMLESDMGQEALFGMIRSLTEEKFGAGAGDNQDLFQLVAETQFNMDRRTVRNLQKLKDSRAQRMRSLATELKTNERAAELKENRTLGGLYQKISGTFDDAYESLAMPVSEYYRDMTGGLQDLERKMLGGSTLSVGVSESGLREQMLATSAASARGETVGKFKGLTIGDAARLSAARGDLNIMRAALPELSGQTSAALKKSGIDITKEMNLLSEQGGSLDRVEMNKLAIKLGLAKNNAGRTVKSQLLDPYFGSLNYDQDQVLAVAAQGGEAGARLVAEANVDRREKADSMSSIEAAQANLAFALGADSIGTNADAGGSAYVFAKGGLLAGLLITAFDTDEEEAIDALKGGGEGTRLLQKYGENSQEIDKMLAGVSREDQYEAAAEKINARYGLNITAAELKTVNTALNQFGTATQRQNDPNIRDRAKKIGKAAEAIERGHGTKKIESALAEIRKAGVIAGAKTENIDDNEAAIAESIKQLAEQGFTASFKDPASAQLLGFGVEAYKGLQGAAKDGLTVAEISGAIQMGEKDVSDFIGQMGGFVSANGTVTAQDQQKLIQQLATYATKNLSVSAKQEQFLNSGMSETERQSLSIYKTAEMVDGLWSKLKTEGVVKVADPAGGTTGGVSGGTSPTAQIPTGAKER
jgi:hypothetical protein